MKDSIGIIGGGIAGLTMALSLRKVDLHGTVFEAAPTYQKSGAGISLAINATQVLKYLGILPEIHSAGNPLHQFTLTTPSLSPLSKVSLVPFEKKYGVTGLAIHRGDLQDILVRHVQPENIQMNHKLHSISGPFNQSLGFECGTKLDFENVIGADGIHSRCRQIIFPESKLRHAKQICWRGICDYYNSNLDSHELKEAWGAGRRFGFVKINSKQYYWYALQSLSDIVPSKDNIAETFKDFHPIIKEIINETNKENIIESPIADLHPLRNWSKGNLTLIGDAAHATTPNLGQGACQAIEDTYVLAQCMAKSNSFEKASREFQILRRPKALKVVKTSWQTGKIAHLDIPTALFLRNTFMKWTPNIISQWGAAQFYKPPL